jgi:hypothetical protein
LIHRCVPVDIATGQKIDLAGRGHNNGKPTIPAKVAADLAVQRWLVSEAFESGSMKFWKMRCIEPPIQPL